MDTLQLTSVLHTNSKFCCDICCPYFSITIATPNDLLQRQHLIVLSPQFSCWFLPPHQFVTIWLIRKAYWTYVRWPLLPHKLYSLPQSSVLIFLRSHFLYRHPSCSLPKTICLPYAFLYTQDCHNLDILLKCSVWHLAFLILKNQHIM